jgi:hypothetical protein
LKENDPKFKVSPGYKMKAGLKNKETKKLETWMKRSSLEH